jgi:predicted nicotinamide N-methyase
VTSLPFKSTVETITIGSVSLQLHTISDLDEAIEHYVAVAPSNTDMIPYYTRLWESARGLSTYLAGHPGSVCGKTVLELGCGLGLPSLVAAGLGARVTATDYHPDNEAFFRQNAEINGLGEIRYRLMDWRRPLLRETFDVVMGSDLIYEKEMVPALVACARRFCNPGGLFLLADPGRSALQETSDQLEQAGFMCEPEVVGDIFVIVAVNGV